MDLLFNRKVVKPIRGGAAAAANSQNNRVSRGRDSSSGRLSNQMNFEQFMSNQKTIPVPKNARHRASVGSIHVNKMDRSPIRGGGFAS